MELEPQEEPTEPPISKKLRIQRVDLEVRLTPKTQTDETLDLHTTAIQSDQCSSSVSLLMFAFRWRCSLKTALKLRVLYQEGARKQLMLLREVCVL